MAGCYNTFMKKIIVLGGGFGGLTCALALSKKIKRLPAQEQRQILLIDQHSYHLYTPPLYEVATASSGDISALNLKKVVTIELDRTEQYGIKFIKDKVEKIDFKTKEIILEDHSKIEFEYLIVAAGTETNFFDIPGLKENAIGLKNLNDALVVRNRLKKLATTQKQITVAVGGAGSTGVEFCGELSHWLRKVGLAKEMRTKVVLIERANSILPGFQPEIIKKAKKRLQELKVQIMAGYTIKNAAKNVIELTSQNSTQTQQLDFDILVWTGGIKASSITQELSLEKTPSSRLVCANLALEIYPDIFAIGDIMSMCYPGTTEPVPANASLAIAQGKIAAENVMRKIQSIPEKQYIPPRNIPYIIPIGGRWAIAKIGSITLFGFNAWLVKQFVELKHFLTFLNPIEALWLWCQGIFFFTRND